MEELMEIQRNSTDMEDYIKKLENEFLKLQGIKKELLSIDNSIYTSEPTGQEVQIVKDKVRTLIDSIRN
jgi:hypothetical protein